VNEVITLPDGRSLGFAQYGNPNGIPLVFFHGTPSSRYLHHPDDDRTASLNVRLITVERPGFGLSDHQPGRTLLDWPDDVEVLAEKLGLKQFAVAGVSGGGPFAAACAFKIPHRLTKAGIISGVGPTDVEENIKALYDSRKAGVMVAKYSPWLLRPLIWLLQNPQRNGEKYFQKILNQSSQADREILSQPAMKSMFLRNWQEGTRNGVRGFAQDGIIFSNPWGFQLCDIQTRVDIWHGDQDTSTPLNMALYMADQIPDCQLRIVPGKGHFLLFAHWDEILSTLTAP
jgi:pimeloyl-ACP methyl ester carboxylesterase